LQAHLREFSGEPLLLHCVRMTSPSAGTINPLTSLIIACAIRVHRTIGPGLLESVYLACLEYELRRAGCRVVRNVPVRIQYEDVALDCAFRADLIVNDLVLIELKSVRRLMPVHIAQTLTYLKLSGLPVALLLNFNVLLMKQGVRRLVNVDLRGETQVG
jgi:GxxExxY protein